MFEQTQVMSEPEDSEDEIERTPVAKLTVGAIREIPAAVFPLYDGENTIGRSGCGCDIQFADKFLSSKHATIEVRASGELKGEIWITDHKSTCKTYLDKRSKKRALTPEQLTPLKDGQTVIFGDVTTVFSMGAPHAEGVSTPPLAVSVFAKPFADPTKEPKRLGDSDTDSEGVLDGAEDTWATTAAKIGIEPTQAYHLSDDEDVPASTKKKRRVTIHVEESVGTPNAKPATLAPPVSPTLAYTIDEATQAYVLDEDDDGGITDASDTGSVAKAPNPAKPEPEATQAYRIDSPESPGLPTHVAEPTQAYALDDDDDGALTDATVDGEASPQVAVSANTDADATQAYDLGADADATQAYDATAIDDDATQVHDAGTDVDATQAYDVSVDADATQAYDMGADADATQAYDMGADADATQAYDMGADADATQAYDMNTDADATQAYNVTADPDATQVYDAGGDDDATQSMDTDDESFRPSMGSTGMATPTQVYNSSTLVTPNKGTQAETPKETPGSATSAAATTAAAGDDGTETEIETEPEDNDVVDEERKTVVRFRNEDSIIPPSQPEEKKAEEATPSCESAPEDSLPSPTLTPAKVNPLPKQKPTSGSPTKSAKRALPAFLRQKSSEVESPPAPKPKKSRASAVEKRSSRKSKSRAEAAEEIEPVAAEGSATEAEATEDEGAGDFSGLTEAEVKKMKVAELKEELADRGFSTSGRKADLMERLLEAISSVTAPEDADDASAKPKTPPPATLESQESEPVRRPRSRRKVIEDDESDEEEVAAMEVDEPEAAAEDAVPPPAIGPRQKSNPMKRSAKPDTKAAELATVQEEPEDAEMQVSTAEEETVEEPQPEKQLEEQPEEEEPEPEPEPTKARRGKRRRTDSSDAVPTAEEKPSGRSKRSRGTRGKAAEQAEAEPAETKAPTRRGRRTAASQEDIVEPEPEPEVVPTPPKGKAKGKSKAKASTKAKPPVAVHETSQERKRRSTLDSLPKVLFTGVIDNPTEKIVKSLHGSVVESAEECTHLFCDDELKRTVKLFKCVCMGKYIVGTKWVSESLAQGQFVDGDTYMVKDAKAEKKHGFSLKKSLKQAREQPVFQGVSFAFLGDLKPTPAELGEIVQAGGGVVLPNLPEEGAEDTYIIASAKAKLKNCSVPVYSAEFVMSGSLQQKLNFKANLLKAAPNSKRKANDSEDRPRKRGRRH